MEEQNSTDETNKDAIRQKLMDRAGFVALLEALTKVAPMIEGVPTVQWWHRQRDHHLARMLLEVETLNPGVAAAALAVLEESGEAPPFSV